MSVLVIGVGLQGRAAVEQLVHEGVAPLWAADLDASAARAVLEPLGCGEVPTLSLDARDTEAVRRAVRELGARVVLGMAPPELQPGLARAAVEAGAHFVNTCYGERLRGLDALARERGLAVLPEMGLDPGLDLLLARLTVDELERVDGLLSYGAGIPAPGDGDPVYRYRASWSLPGVLAAYRRPARYRWAGEERRVPGGEVFEPRHLQRLEIPGVGRLEAYPNGDALAYAEALGLDGGTAYLGRFTMRWPGHAELWRALHRAGLLDDTPVELAPGGERLAPVDFLARMLAPRFRYRPGERDLAVLRVHAWGERGGRPAGLAWELVDVRDPETGLYAMNRTVGYTAAVAARLLLEGAIRGRGLLDPLRHVSPEPVLDALRRRGIQARRRELPPGPPPLGLEA